MSARPPPRRPGGRHLCTPDVLKARRLRSCGGRTVSAAETLALPGPSAITGKWRDVQRLEFTQGRHDVGVIFEGAGLLVVGDGEGRPVFKGRSPFPSKGRGSVGNKVTSGLRSLDSH